MTDELERYILDHIDGEDDCLYELYRATNVHLLYGRMASGHLQGRLLKLLVELAKPQNIVEIGTFSGYSAICMAQGLAALQNPSSRLITFEINDELEDFTRGWIEKSGLSHLIDFRIGDALTEIPKLGMKFDFAFMDGDKRKYPEYYEMLMGVMNKGGLIVADNTLWDGHVLDTPEPNARHKDQQTVGIQRFNDIVAADDRVEKVILPLRDGLTLIRRLDG